MPRRKCRLGMGAEILGLRNTVPAVPRLTVYSYTIFSAMICFLMLKRLSNAQSRLTCNRKIRQLIIGFLVHQD